MVMKIASSALMAAVCFSLVFSGSVHAAESDAREVFSVAAAGAMTFSSARVVEDVSLVYLHFTSAGRMALIGELERTGLVKEVVSKRMAVRGDMPVSAVQARRRVGADGLDEYEMVGDMKLQWSRCVDGGCTDVGGPKSVKVTGVVVQATLNGRPAYRVSGVRYGGAR